GEILAARIQEFAVSRKEQPMNRSEIAYSLRARFHLRRFLAFSLSLFAATDTQTPHLPARAGVPKAYRAIEPAGSEDLVVRRPAQLQNGPLMTCHLVNRL